MMATAEDDVGGGIFGFGGKRRLVASYLPTRLVGSGLGGGWEDDGG